MESKKLGVRPLAERVQYLERMRAKAATKAGELRHEAEAPEPAQQGDADERK